MESPRETARALRWRTEQALCKTYGPVSSELKTFTRDWQSGTWEDRARLCVRTLRDCQEHEAWARRWGSV